MVARALAVLAIAGCSGNTKVGEDAKPGSSAPRAIDAAPAPVVIDAAGSAAPVGTGPGDAAIRVEWKAVPTAARTSPGRTPCKTPRAASVAPATMWGIPEAFVIVDGVTTPPGEGRITVADCKLAPRVLVASTLNIESTRDRPAQVTLAKHGAITDLANLAVADTKTIQLPIAGHVVTIALEPGGVYQLAIDAESEPAWIVAGSAAITDVSGLATIRAASGTRAVTAWVPARGGRPAKLTKSTVTIDSNQQVELAVDLGPP